MERQSENFKDIMVEEDFIDDAGTGLLDSEELSISESALVDVILMCEECLHQWDDNIFEKDEKNQFCPLCGSSVVIIIYE